GWAQSRTCPASAAPRRGGRRPVPDAPAEARPPLPPPEPETVTTAATAETAPSVDLPAEVQEVTVPAALTETREEIVISKESTRIVQNEETPAAVEEELADEPEHVEEAEVTVGSEVGVAQDEAPAEAATEEFAEVAFALVAPELPSREPAVPVEEVVGHGGATIPAPPLAERPVYEVHLEDEGQAAATIDEPSGPPAAAEVEQPVPEPQTGPVEEPLHAVFTPAYTMDFTVEPLPE